MSEKEHAPVSSDIPLDLPEIQRILLDWFQDNSRNLPWRETRDPYRILISEVMLQQTQVDRVIPRYHAFLERFPTVGALAAAPASAVIQEWAGLGYNRRAVNLQRAARAVVEDHDGRFPSDVETLRRLPGIGPYTAGAIACFAFERDVGFLDTNIRRLLHRLFIGPEVPQLARTAAEMQRLAAGIVPAGEGWAWNQALIEFGALQCTSRKPACLTCPLQHHCRAFPEIQTVLTDLARAGFRRKNEAVFEGSSRFYRGRVVHALRELMDGEELELECLGSQVRDDYGPEHSRWLNDLVDGLHRDGLIQIIEERAEYDADHPRARRVRLPG